MYIIVETIFFLHIVSYENCYMFLNIQYFYINLNMKLYNLLYMTNESYALLLFLWKLYFENIRDFIYDDVCVSLLEI